MSLLSSGEPSISCTDDTSIDQLSYSEVVEAKRNALAAQVISLLRQMNELTYPARLPPELLTLVFANMEPCRTYTGESSSILDGCLAAAQVCHQWREIALRTPHLWAGSILLCRPTRYIQMMLERSGRCPLDITVDVLEDADESPLNAFLWDQLHRTRSITLVAPLDS